MLLKISSPSFVSQKIFNKSLTAFYKKKVLRLNKPAYMGMGIFNLNRTLMDDFHYNYIKEKYGHKAKQTLILTV